jgi:murein DD-endopeptidase MepM/ murein hydrolase activator NlpD
VRLGLVLAVLVGVNLYVFLWRDQTSIPDVMEMAAVASDGDPLAHAGSTPAAADAEAAPSASPEAGRWIDGQVEPDDSLGQILRREGLDPPQADELIRALQPVMDLRKIRAGQTYRLHLDDDGRVLAFELVVHRTLTLRVDRGADGALSARAVTWPTETRVIEMGGQVQGSLYASLTERGESGALVAFFVDVFAYDINFYIDTHAGDTFRMVVEKVYLDGAFLEYGRVLAAEYTGKVGTFRAFFWTPPGRARGDYYDEAGRNVAKTFLKTPLKYSRVSSHFNPRRMHPILHRVKGHWGVDYAAPTGTPVWAAASGRIVSRGRQGGAGNCVVLRHGNGLSTIYMHLSRFQKNQRVGQSVAQKTVIGYVGETGLATGPHLHFGVKRDGRYVDPGKIKMKRGPGVPVEHKDEFARHTAELVAQLEAVAVDDSAPTSTTTAPATGTGALALPR